MQNYYRISMDDVIMRGLFSRTEQPAVVYHMTDRKNAESILRDLKLKTFRDYMVYCFPSLKDVTAYIYLTNADEGRFSYDFDQFLHRLPPLNHADTVVMELKPRYKEPLCWFKPCKKLDEIDPLAIKYWDTFNACRIAHYGDFKFDSRCVKIHELKEIDKLYPISLELEDMRWKLLTKRIES